MPHACPHLAAPVVEVPKVLVRGEASFQLFLFTKKSKVVPAFKMFQFSFGYLTDKISAIFQIAIFGWRDLQVMPPKATTFPTSTVAAEANDCGNGALVEVAPGVLSRWEQKVLEPLLMWLKPSIR